MRIDWDVPIAMEDGLVLRADVFRLVAEGKYPVYCTFPDTWFPEQVTLHVGPDRPAHLLPPLVPPK